MSTQPFGNDLAKLARLARGGDQEAAELLRQQMAIHLPRIVRRALRTDVAPSPLVQEVRATADHLRARGLTNPDRLVSEMASLVSEALLPHSRQPAADGHPALETLVD